MTTLLILGGSLRSASYNTALARALAELAPADVHVDVATPHGIPLYDGDAEAADGVPGTVRELQERLGASDGLILVSPEYNQGVPGVLKNTIDWLTRPPSQVAQLFRGRPVAVCGASPGAGGTRTAQYAWLPTLRGLGMQVWNEQGLALGGAGDAFDSTGSLSDDDQRTRAQNFITGFARFVARLERDAPAV